MNNIWTYTIIGFIFLGIFGGISLIGAQVLVNNDRLDSDSIAEIGGLDTELYTDFEIDPTTGNVTAIRVSDERGAFEGAQPEEREYLQSRSDVSDTEVSYTFITNIPRYLVSSLSFVGLNDVKFYLGLLGSLITTALALVFYKAWRTGRVDND